MRPKAFAGAGAFRRWLEAHHERGEALLVRCFKVHAKEQGLTYVEALDEALCFGWIDGVRRAIDAFSFSVRFSPRKPRSQWSAVNVRRVGALVRAGRMRPSGLAAFRARDAGKRAGYSYEERAVELDAASAGRLRRNRRAWSFFRSQPPWYRRTSAFWVMSAKRDETRQRRLEALISCSELGRPIPELDRKGKRT